MTSINNQRGRGRLENKVAIVTGMSFLSFLAFFYKHIVPIDKEKKSNVTHTLLLGGGSGYGEGIALAFAAEGASVIVADINKEAGERVAARDSANLFFHYLDVTKEESWTEIMQFVTKRWGKCDVLVNNAGASYVNKVSYVIARLMGLELRHGNQLSCCMCAPGGLKVFEISNYVCTFIVDVLLTL